MCSKKNEKQKKKKSPGEGETKINYEQDGKKNYKSDSNLHLCCKDLFFWFNLLPYSTHFCPSEARIQLT